ADQPVVERAENRPVRIRVVGDPCPRDVGRAQPVRSAAWNRAFEESAGMTSRERGERGAVARYDIDRLRTRDERADDDRAARLVNAEHCERVVVSAFDD